MPGENDAYLVITKDETTRFCKKPRSTHIFVGFNEWVCSALLKTLDFPGLPFGVLSSRNELFFWLEYVPDGERVKGPVGHDSHEVEECGNFDEVIYQAVAFDAWVLNPDRHHNNVLVRRGGPSPARAYLIDHDLAIFHARRSPSDVEALGTDYIDGWEPHVTAWLREDWRGTWREGIVDPAKLASAVEAIKGIKDSDIEDVLENVPHAWKTPERCTAAARFLKMRRDKITEIVAARSACFPNLIPETAGSR